MKNLSLALLFSLSFFVQSGKTQSLLAEPINPELLEKYNGQIRENPQYYKRRWQRAMILLKHGDDGKTTAEDIDTLLSHPDWRKEGNRLLAMRLYLQGRLEEAKARMRQNILDTMHQEEQSALLAGIELAAKDTAAAVAAYRLAWDRYHDENVYAGLLNLYRVRNEAPDDLLQQGLRLYPTSPGSMQTVFETYFGAGGSANLRKCAEISGHAETTLWPLSVEWKVRHARVLLALGQSQDAGVVLQNALDLMDGDPRLQTNSDDVPLLRSEIFTLLDSSRHSSHD